LVSAPAAVSVNPKLGQYSQTLMFEIPFLTFRIAQGSLFSQQLRDAIYKVLLELGFESFSFYNEQGAPDAHLQGL
jgi:hypothetical protein